MSRTPEDAAERQYRLDLRRRQRMARSAYSFVRGDISNYYGHVRELGVAMPEGPALWICGDCHFGNLGPLSDGRDAVDVQIRDLDQTVVGNPSQDVLRLALSFASVARASDIPGERILRIIAEVLHGYAAGLGDEGAAPEPAGVKAIRRHASNRVWHQFAQDRLGGSSPTITQGKHFWPLFLKEKHDLADLVADPAIARRVLDVDRPGEIELVDAAYWVKGCSSLGHLRFAVTVRAGKQIFLLDVKEAVAPLPPIARGSTMPAGDAHRVVEGARALSPNLGARLVAAEVAGRPVFVRVLSPKDLKLEKEVLVGRDAEMTARHLGSVVGQAHGRQLSAGERMAWARKVAAFGEGEWLWQGTLALIGRYEAAYLRHCAETMIAEPVD